SAWTASTVIVTVAERPPSSWSRAQRTYCWATEHAPWEAVAWMKRAPVGSWSLRLISVVGAGPALVTVRSYSNWPPWTAGFGVDVIVTPRSADGRAASPPEPG